MAGMYPAEAFFRKVDFTIKHGDEQVVFFDVLHQTFVDVGNNSNALSRAENALAEKCTHRCHQQGG